MLNKLIHKLLSEIVQENKLHCCYNSSYFKLENRKFFDNDRISSITVLFVENGTYSLIINADGNIEYLNGLFDVQTLYLLHILRDKLNNNYSLTKSLEELLKQYKKIKEAMEEFK